MKKRIVLVAVCLGLIGTVSAQKVFTLEECRQLAIENNKELRISGEKVKQAGEERNAARTKYFPQVSATGAYLWNQHDINLFDFGKLGAIGALIPSTITDIFRLDIQDVWVGSISLVQPVFMGGKIVSYNQITSYARQLAESMNDLQLQEVIYQTDETYWQVISLVHKKKLSDAYVDLLKKMDSDVQAMIAEGVATPSDGLSVRVKLNEAEMTQTKVDNGLALSRMLLAQICGLPLEEPLALADELLEQYPVTQKTALIDVNEAFANRNELKSLDLATRIYEKKENIVLADMLPQMALVGNYMVTNPNVRNGFKNDFAGGFHVGVTLQIPLSGWWEGSHKRNAARAETNIQRLQYEEAREKIELQVNQSVYQTNEAQKKLIASSRNMEMAEENLRHANDGFEEGVIPALNLMEAQTAWVQARSGLIDAQIDVKLTEVYLAKMMGKLGE
ncbi:outer membrane protein TolC [Parabacteroides sp. PFB2-12]|uniref:TolC family protein n=1 Tax=unclassified Parabacteroides TaxID=2649774 RepID=UPI0024743DA3|nr:MULTISPECIES: TolC family protein [unclassified Parabacteroides]MDH6344182.1 outer membrane protein TolC [Parabacteroides sp. PM6-13]MDH6392089.1 outer membrane protein TolC [Parabacteroides sp. PFB2-12]